MSREESVALRLGRALIAIAWSDGRLDEDERSGLSDILFRLPQLRPQEWSQLQEYLKSAPSAAESRECLAALRAGFDEGGEEILPFLEQLADEASPFSEADRALASQLRAELEASRGANLTSWTAGLRDRLRRGAVRVREELENLRRGQEELRGRLPAQLQERLDATGLLEKLGEEEFQRITLLGALLGRVAHADHRLDDAEIKQMASSIRELAGLNAAEARLVCEIGREQALEAVDSYALSREFFLISEEPERIATLDLLFRVAHSDGELSPHEVEEIRRIRQGFLLSHRHFADARVRAREEFKARGD